jgi:hypothetical protein
LDHEALDDAVKDRVVIVPAASDGDGRRGGPTSITCRRMCEEDAKQERCNG